MLERIKRALAVLFSDPYEPEYVVTVDIPKELQDHERAQARFSWLDRGTLIFNHYLQGPLFGFNLRIFRPEKHHSEPEKIAAVLMLGVYLVGFWMAVGIWPLYGFGLALILFCPQWLYAFSGLQHTIFEYRGYLFACGIAAIGAAVVDRYPVTLLIAAWVIGFFILQTRKRLEVYSDPLLFWKQARLDIPTDSLLASAYMYQLQKRERFGEVDDLYRWMTAARIPDCRTLLLNLAAAKFGMKSDNAELDRPKMQEALAILEETARRWPNHEDVWRNVGTVEYYLCATGLDGYAMERPIASLKKALAIQPHDSLTWLGLGHCYMYEGRWEAAVNALQHSYNYLPAGAYLAEDVSLVRVKLMEALEKAAEGAEDEEWGRYYRREFGLHQQALEKHMAWYVTEENARYLV